MATQVGEYCMRCGAQSVISEDNGYHVWTCPRGHGEQRRAPLEATQQELEYKPQQGDASRQAKTDEGLQEQETEKEEPARLDKKAKPPPKKPPAAPGKKLKEWLGHTGKKPTKGKR